MATFQLMSFEAGDVADPIVKACVTSMEGSEGINSLYRFELELALVEEKQGAALTQNCADINLDRLFLSPAHLVFNSQVQGQVSSSRIHGIVESFEILGFEASKPICRVVMRPRLWKLTRSRRSRVFLNKTIKQIVEQLMLDAGLSSSDYRFAGDFDRPAREYVTQYDETDYAFLCRWLEYEGFYFFVENFDRDSASNHASEVVVLCGDGAPQSGSTSPAALNYQAQTAATPTTPPVRPKFASRVLAVLGVASAVPTPPFTFPEEDWLSAEKVRGIALAQTAPIKEIVVNDYDWKNPTVSLACTQTVHDAGSGVLEEIDNQYTTAEEGNRIAGVRKQEVLAREKVFCIATNSRNVRVGMAQPLAQHPRAGFNTSYFVIEIEHYGSQKISASGSEFGATYRNVISAIPSDPTNRPYRPARVTPWPKVSGVVRATVQSAAKSGINTPWGKIAKWDADMAPDLDENGNYVVQLGFDREGRPNGQASNRIRLAQPYAGAYKGDPMGFHFPLRAHTEVILTHVNGNPDRPVIAGALPNKAADPASVSYDRRKSRNIIRTQGDNRFIMSDSKYARSVDIRAGNSRSRMKFTNYGLHELDEVDGNPADSSKATSEILSINTTQIVGDLVTNCGFYKWGADSLEAKMDASEKCGIVAGFPRLLNSLRAIKLALLHADDWARSALEDAGVSAGVESCIFATKTIGMYLFKKIMKDKFISDAMKNLAKKKHLPATRERVMKKLQRVTGSAVKEAGFLAKKLAKVSHFFSWTPDPAASLLCYGIRIQRGPHGTVVEAQYEGENMLICTEKGAIDIHAGENIDMVAKASVDVQADEDIALTSGGAALELSKDKARMVSPTWHTKIDMTDEEILLTNAKSGKRHHIMLGKDDIIAYGGDIHLSSTNAKAELFLGKDGKIRVQSDGGAVEVKVGKSFVSVQDNTVSVQAAGDLKLCASGKVDIDGKGGVTIKGQKVSVRGADVEMLAASSAKVDATNVSIAGAATAIGRPSPLVPMPPIPVVDVLPPVNGAPAAPPPFTTVEEAAALANFNVIAAAMRQRRAMALGLNLRAQANFNG